jgi:hypothetical protein
MIYFTKAGKEGGKTLYHIHRKQVGTIPSFLGMIRYFDKHDVANLHRAEGAGWVLLYYSGRSESFDTLAEAKDAALKI